MASPHGRVHTPGARRYTPPANTRRPAILKIPPQRHVHTPLRKTAHAHLQYVMPMPFDGCVFPHATTCDKNMMTTRPRVVTPDSGNRLTFPMFPSSNCGYIMTNITAPYFDTEPINMKDFALHSTLKIRGKAYEIVGIVKYRMPDKDNAVLNKYILQHSQEMKELLFDNAEGLYILQEWMPHVTRTPPDSSWRELSNDVMVIDKSSTKDMFSQRDIEKPFRITIYQKKTPANLV